MELVSATATNTVCAKCFLPTISLQFNLENDRVVLCVFCFVCALPHTVTYVIYSMFVIWKCYGFRNSVPVAVQLRIASFDLNIEFNWIRAGASRSIAIRCEKNKCIFIGVFAFKSDRLLQNAEALTNERKFVTDKTFVWVANGKKLRFCYST